MCLSYSTYSIWQRSKSQNKHEWVIGLGAWDDALSCDPVMTLNAQQTLSFRSANTMCIFFQVCSCQLSQSSSWSCTLPLTTLWCRSTLGCQSALPSTSSTLSNSSSSVWLCWWWPCRRGCHWLSQSPWRILSRWAICSPCHCWLYLFVLHMAVTRIWRR